VLFLLNQPQSALQTELNGFFQQVTDAALESCHVTASAFCKARQKLDPAVFEALNQAIQAQLDAQGLRLLAIDGSMVRVDPHPEIAVVWGQDRDISGKGQYTKIYSQLFEVSGEELREETGKTENVAIRFINNQLHVQRYELLAGDIGKLMVASVKGSGIGAGEESSSLSDREIFSVFPIDDATRVSVAESYRELQSPGGKPFPRIELGRVSLPRVAMPLKERKIVTTPDYAYSVNEQYLSVRELATYTYTVSRLANSSTL